MKYEKTRQTVLDAILDCVDMGLIHGTSGNIAMRDPDDDVVAITPSGIPYKGMTADQIAIVDLNGKWLDGPFKPSSETPMHTAVIRARKGINATVHTHGMANACVLPYVMEYNASACPEKMVELAKAIGLQPSGDLEKDKLLLSQALLALIKELNIKTLSQQGIQRSDFAMLADDVLREPVLGFNPRQGVTKEDVIAILEKAF